MTKDVQDLMNRVERIRDGFHQSLFADGDAAGLVAQASSDCELSILPAGTGAVGAGALGRFVADDLALPADLRFRRVSRTGDRWQVVDEDVVTFTHDRELPWLLPGVAATGRAAEVLVITVVAVRHSAVTRYRALWDQLALAAQLEVDVGRAPISGADAPNTRSSSRDRNRSPARSR